jgi:MerR family redox-sensitive transcriptional activator SoxR
MKLLSIGEVARQVNLATSAIRYYESIGLLPEPPRVSGQRRYPPDALQRLQMIRAAQEIGFSLAEIKTLLDGFSPQTPPSARWQSLAEAKLPEVEALIAQATLLKRVLERGLNCECVTLEACFAEGKLAP